MTQAKNFIPPLQEAIEEDEDNEPKYIDPEIITEVTQVPENCTPIGRILFQARRNVEKGASITRPPLTIERKEAVIIPRENLEKTADWMMEVLNHYIEYNREYVNSFNGLTPAGDMKWTMIEYLKKYINPEYQQKGNIPLITFCINYITERSNWHDLALLDGFHIEMVLMLNKLKDDMKTNF